MNIIQGLKQITEIKPPQNLNNYRQEPLRGQIISCLTTDIQDAKTYNNPRDILLDNRYDEERHIIIKNVPESRIYGMDQSIVNAQLFFSNAHISNRNLSKSYIIADDNTKIHAYARGNSKQDICLVGESQLFSVAECNSHVNYRFFEGSKGVIGLAGDAIGDISIDGGELRVSVVDNAQLNLTAKNAKLTLYIGEDAIINELNLGENTIVNKMRIKGTVQNVDCADFTYDGYIGHINPLKQRFENLEMSRLYRRAKKSVQRRIDTV